MTRFLLTFGAIAALAAAQSGIESPLAGFVRDSAGNLRPILGLGGGFIAGQTLSNNVESVSAAEGLVLVKTSGSIQVRDSAGTLIAEQAAPPGAALFAISPGGREAVVFLPATGEWWRWDGGRFTTFESEPDVEGAEILAIAMPSRGRLSLVVRNGAGISLVTLPLYTGRLRTTPPIDGVSAPLLLLRDGTLLSASNDSLSLRTASGETRRIELNCSPSRLAEMGQGWIHIASECGQFALRFAAERDDLHRLPEVAE